MVDNLTYWYDGQMRRFLEQVVRLFSGFQYMNGKGNLIPVPCRPQAGNRMVAHILRNNSENTLLSLPMITVSQTGLTMRREDLQHPGHVDTLSLRERARDELTGEYTSGMGNGYTVQRLMPRPFMMAMQIDIWTSNLDQKHQLSEQILTTICPDLEIQNSTNPLDWGALTYIRVDDITWTSRSVEVGTDDTIDIMTVTCSIPIWLSPPAKLMDMKRIETIITNINDNENPTYEEGVVINTPSPMDRVVVTEGNYHLRVEKDKLTLLSAEGALKQGGKTMNWFKLFEKFGTVRPGVSQIRLRQTDDIEDDSKDLIGTIHHVAGKDNELHWQIDPLTLPVNTVPDITGIIDPHKNWNGNGFTANVGDRYLLLASVGSSQAWGGLTATTNDIVEYSASGWNVSFDSSEQTANEHYVLSKRSGTQLKWNKSEWVVSIDGDYSPGFWRIFL